MNSTVAKARKGQSVAYFPIRLPLWAGAESQHVKVLGKLTHLTTSADPAEAEVEARLAYWLKFQTSAMPFRFNLGDHTAIGPNEITKKFYDNFNVDTRGPEMFPLLESLPIMFYDKGGNADTETVQGAGGVVFANPLNAPHMTLLMPPMTSFYSTSPAIWRLLGFPLKMADATFYHLPVTGNRKRVVLGRTAGSARVMFDVFGYFNETNEELIFHGKPFGPGETIADRHAEPTDKDLYQVQFQFEVVQSNGLMLERGRMESRPGPVSEFFNALMRDLALYSNLKLPPIYANPGQDGGAETMLVLSVCPQEGTSATLELRLYETWEAALALPSRRRIHFDLSSPRDFKMEMRNWKQDPFKNLYPVMMVACSPGLAQSWVEGCGYFPIAAMLPDLRKPLQSAGLPFDCDNGQLVCQFYDFQKKLILFPFDFNIHLIIKFDPPKQEWRSARTFPPTTPTTREHR